MTIQQTISIIVFLSLIALLLLVSVIRGIQDYNLNKSIIKKLNKILNHESINQKI